MPSHDSSVRKAVAAAGGKAMAALREDHQAHSAKMLAARHEKRKQRILAKLPHLVNQPEELERRAEMLRLSEIEAMRAKALQARVDARKAAARADQAEADYTAETG